MEFRKAGNGPRCKQEQLRGIHITEQVRPTIRVQTRGQYVLRFGKRHNQRGLVHTHHHRLVLAESNVFLINIQRRRQTRNFRGVTVNGRCQHPGKLNRTGGTVPLINKALNPLFVLLEQKRSELALVFCHPHFIGHIRRSQNGMGTE